MAASLTITKEIKDKIVARANELDCDLVSFWDYPGEPITYGNSKTQFRTQSYVTRFGDHQWIEVCNINIGDNVELS